ncbi:winged helix-turn-helix transcriptional regulator [Streptomyces rugosispiralis]|uniref:Helix-turn-helix transcriptional regulator n=1 Tax=Streptomyces rugosispiralis TaxID=2967341 RepID=A0ABT1URW7_9ACTN|nr:helix-turn-helix domain-containing protein [Streptomyces rugosispiralis]MCQ8187855.1 helix-turn-helix transcriptional regulator [Streptomyces rugosispiralis]
MSLSYGFGAELLRSFVGSVSSRTPGTAVSSFKDLEADRIVVRKDFQELPPHVEYSLTPFGSSLAEALRPLCEWGYAHMDRIGALASQPVGP